MTETRQISVNGIERRYTPIHVAPAAPAGASAQAAVMQAAYAALVSLSRRRRQPSTRDARRAVSLVEIGAHDSSAALVFWRPVTAIPLADTDGNPATIQDMSWAPLFATPGTPRVPVGPLLRQRRRDRRARGSLRRY